MHYVRVKLVLLYQPIYYLRNFMLQVVYFVHRFQGMEGVSTYSARHMLSSNKVINNQYRQIFETAIVMLAEG